MRAGGVGLSARLLLALLATSLCPTIGQGTAAGPSLEAVGTLFRVTTPDGRVLTSPDLIGAVLDVTDEAGRTITVRIDGVDRDPSDVDGEVWLHRFSVRDAGSGDWREFCVPGPDGTVAGFPVAGSWTTDGRHVRGSSGFTVACTAGAIGKCVRFGYKPWRDVAGESFWDYHQACVRLMRADYGGDGIGHTRTGTWVDFFDRLGIQRPGSDPRDQALEFEAAWGPDGAVCVRRTRIPEVVSLDELARRYPHLAGKIGPDCSEKVAALIWNRS
jgi:ADYC domain